MKVLITNINNAKMTQYNIIKIFRFYHSAIYWSIVMFLMRVNG